MQLDNNPEVEELKTAFLAIPAEVNLPKDLPIAEELISVTAKLLEVGPASRPAVHPRPANAGLMWNDLPEESRETYDAVVDCLNADPAQQRLTSEHVQRALEAVRMGLMRISQLMQQPYSGMVQRNS